MHNAAVAAADAAACMRACVRACAAACTIDNMNQLINSLEQTQARRIEFPYRNIREYFYTKIRFFAPTLSARLGLAGQICMSYVVYIWPARPF